VNEQLAKPEVLSYRKANRISRKIEGNKKAEAAAHVRTFLWQVEAAATALAENA